MFDFLSSPCVLSYDHSIPLRRGLWVCRTVKGAEALLCYVTRQQETHTALHKLCRTLPGRTSQLCHLKILKVWTDKSFHPVALVPSFVPVLQDCCRINQVNILNVFSSVPGKSCYMCWFFWLLFVIFFPSKAEHSFRILLNMAPQQPLATD